jgi:protein O-mannosyl-transferase
MANAPTSPPSQTSPAAPGPPAKFRLNDQHLVGLLILLALLCYGNSLFHAFVYDDEQQILQNPYVKSWHYLPQIFNSTVWSFVGAAGATNYYRPLMTFSFLILWQIFGDIPFGFHLFNITLNAAVVVMVFYAGRRLFRDGRIAFVAAALFAIHPIHTEVVDWIAAVPELEVTFFVLLTFWFFMRTTCSNGVEEHEALTEGAEPAKRTDARFPSWKFHAASVTAFAAALLSKEPALMFAPLALAYEFFVRPRNAKTAPGTSRSSTLAVKAARCIPLCMVAAAYLLLRIALFGKLAPVLQHPKVTWPQAIYSAFALVAGYAKYLVWPAPLSAFHVFHVSDSLTQPAVLAGIAVCAVTASLVIALRKRVPVVAFCILWIGVTIAPMLNARWMAANVFTERYLYLPSVGFCWLVAWVAVRVWDQSLAAPSAGTIANGTARSHVNPARTLFLAAAAVIAVTSITAVIRRNTVWSDDMSLYTRTLQTNPDAAVIRSNLGALYFDQKQYDRALHEWQTALAQKPDNTVTMNALGIVYTRLDRDAEAAAILHQAIDARPLWGDSHFNYALLLQKTGNLPGALKEFQAAVTLAPLSGPAHRWYGEALAQNNQLDEAAAQFRSAVELEGTLESMQDLVDVYHRQGRDGEAIPVLRRILKQYPYDSSTHLALAKSLESTGQTTEALREYQQVLATDSANAEAQAAVHRLSR